MEEFMVPRSVGGRILAEYRVWRYRYRILEAGGGPVYAVEEPAPPEPGRLEVYLRALEEVREDPGGVEGSLEYVSRKHGLTAEEREYLWFLVEKYIRGYHTMDPLMRDPHIEEIDARHHGEEPTYRYWVFLSLRDKGITGWLPTNIEVTSLALARTQGRLGVVVGRSLSGPVPYAEGVTPEGYRVTMAKPPYSGYPLIIVRKRPPRVPLIGDLIRGGMLTSLIYSYLWILLQNRKTVLIIGSTGSGKTTFLQSLLAGLGGMKIVTLEDTPEINLCDVSETGERLACHPGWQSLYTIDHPDPEYRRDLLDLVKSSLRMRPDVIAVGEVRGREAVMLVQAGSTGHGALATMHGEDARDILNRLVNLGVDRGFLLGMGAIVSLAYIRERRTRRVVGVYEVTGEQGSDGLPLVRRVFTYSLVEDRHEPGSPKTVVSRSWLLRRIGEYRYGPLWRRMITAELALRAHLIDKLIKENPPQSYMTVYNTLTRINTQVGKTLEALLEREKTGRAPVEGRKTHP